jgi:signal transduction histidine kinase
LIQWGLIFGAWTVIGLIEACLNMVMMELNNKPISIPRAVFLGVSDWYIWAAFTPLILWGMRSHPIEQRQWPARFVLHLVASFAVSLAIIAIQIPILEWINPAPSSSVMPEPVSSFDLFTRLLLFRLVLYIVVYWVILAITHAIAYYRKFREREMQAVLLESRLTQAQLQVLKMQLQPHFLFNTLNAISALMHQDVELADRMIARLAELLRSTLESAGTQEVPLKQELEFIELYLEIEQARLGPRLVVRMDAEPEVMDAYVPNLILQPLVENAIRHGIAPRPETGHIEIRAHRQNGCLQVEVLDDGPGLSPNTKSGGREGVGLANTRARLKQLYGAAHQFTVANRRGGGLAVTLRVPFRELPEEFITIPSLDNGSSACPPGTSFWGILTPRSL